MGLVVVLEVPHVVTYVKCLGLYGLSKFKIFYFGFIESFAKPVGYEYGMISTYTSLNLLKVVRTLL